MNKFLLTIGMLALTVATAMAQGGTTWPLVTIRQVQEVPADSLTATPPKDRSPFDGDTVRVRGRLVTLPGQAYSSDDNRAARWVWIQSGTGPWSGINYRPGSYVGASGGAYDFSTGIPGDSVEVVGFVNLFGNPSGNETQMTPWNLTGGYVTRFPVPPVAPQPTTIDACDLNDANGNWKATTGEQWEGVYVKIKNATVVSVPGTRSANRQDFVVESNGCRVTIYATFNVMRTNASTLTNSVLGANYTVYPNFVAPQVGDFYDSIWGMCNYVTSDGYTISPWDTAQFKKGVAQIPQITNVARNLVLPTTTQSVTVTANVNFSQGTPTARLYYAKGLNNPTFDSVNMVSGPNGFSATIPAVSDSAYVKYYIKAFGGGLSVTAPANFPTTYSFYRVGNNGLQISDIQFTPFASGSNPGPLVGQVVTVTGIVTASQNDLERIFIQEEGRNTWAGLEVTGNLQLAALNTGDRVTVTGTAQENFGFTRIGLVTSVSTSGTGTITPVELEPQFFASPPATYAMEVYEGMLVKIKSNDPAPNDSIYIIQNNADNTSNFGEFRVGKNVATPTVGIRVKTGRYNSEPASPNVCYLIPQGNPGVLLNDTACAQVVQVGARMKSLTGVMFWSFSNFKLYPRNNADFEAFSQAPLSIASIEEQDNQVMIYPNPASYEVVIRVDNNLATNWTLLDVSGRTVKSERLNGQFSTVDISGIQQGTYISVLTNALNGEILQRGKLMITK